MKPTNKPTFSDLKLGKTTKIIFTFGSPGCSCFTKASQISLQKISVPYLNFINGQKVTMKISTVVFLEITN